MADSSGAGLSAALLFSTLPEDVLARVLSLLPLPILPPTLAALRATCRQAEECLAADGLWQSLLLLIEGGAPSSISHRRKSERLSMSGEAVFARAWRALISRCEALHHAVAIAGQDTRNLTVGTLKAILQRWGPCKLVDRASPVYNATLLMEVCKARGTREANLVACARHLLSPAHGADVNARPAGDAPCTPLIIAACRGLPKLVAELLAHGADPTPRGEGRFRLCGSHKSLFGRRTALEWVAALLAAETAHAVPEQDRLSLVKCQRLIEQHVIVKQHVEQAETAWPAPASPQPPSPSGLRLPLDDAIGSRTLVTKRRKMREEV